jgi:hypothetical protein
MATDAATVHILGLDALDKNELERALGQDDVQFEEVNIPEGTYGDPGTIIAVVVISVAIIKGLTAWLMKKRRKGIVQQEIEIEYPDGRKVRKTIQIDVSSSDPAKVLNQLGAAFEIDEKLLTQAAGS